MKQKTIPGYQAMFGEPSIPYEMVLAEVPSYEVISIASLLNNELEAPLDYKINQHRILKSFSKGFTDQQKQLLEIHLNRLANSGYGEDAFEIFHRRYLIAFILRELARNKKNEQYVHANGKDFQILLAYLLIIDEEHAKDRIILDECLTKQNEPFIGYRLIWTGNISQFQFNEFVSPSFELFKLMCLLRYALIIWRTYLKEYLSLFGFDSIGQLLGSYKEVFKATEQYNPNIAISKYADIAPKPGVNIKHLESLCINQIIGNKFPTLLDFKKHPLLYTDSKFRVMDANLFYKHMYKGPLFDLNKKTSLHKEKDFNPYSSEISKKVMEEVCFKSILKTMYGGKGVLYFDDKTDSIPDCYYRDGDTIILIEFKANILKDDIVEKPDFDNIKSYIDERFIETGDGKVKGIGQLINQIENIRLKKYEFDPEMHSPDDKSYTIYPVICHNDFHFSLPGINDYVDNKFKMELPFSASSAFNIKHVTFINLDCLFDLSLRKGTFIILERLINNYWEKIGQNETSFNRQFNSDTFLNAKGSFDEIYQHIFTPELPLVKNSPGQFDILLQHADLTQETLNEIV